MFCHNHGRGTSYTWLNLLIGARGGHCVHSLYSMLVKYLSVIGAIMIGGYFRTYKSFEPPRKAW